VVIAELRINYMTQNVDQSTNYKA